MEIKKIEQENRRVRKRGTECFNRSTTALDVARVDCAMDGMATDVFWNLKGRVRG